MTDIVLPWSAHVGKRFPIIDDRQHHQLQETGILKGLTYKVNSACAAPLQAKCAHGGKCDANEHTIILYINQQHCGRLH